jgi:hypothetical protein
MSKLGEDHEFLIKLRNLAQRFEKNDNSSPTVDAFFSLINARDALPQQAMPQHVEAFLTSIILIITHKSAHNTGRAMRALLAYLRHD